MRILATFVILCAIFCTACGSKPTNPDASVAVKNSYDAGIAAYKRGHYQAALYDLDPRANAGDPIAQFCLGFMYKYGLGVAANREKAEEWYTKAAEQGYPAAQNNLGAMYVRRYEESEGNPKILETAEKWFQRAAEQGYLPAQHNLGVIRSGQIRLKWWSQAAAQGYAPSQLELGNLYYRGDGVDQDFTEAMKWYSKAAKQNNPLAQSNLGSCYFYGRGVKEDLREAARWYRKAAKQGYDGGQFGLALAYQQGRGVDKNEAEAVRWYRKAAERGNLEAQNNLAVLYATATENSEMASRWYLLAAQQGQSVAQSNLGTQFLQGKELLPQDSLEAYYWYGLALKNKTALEQADDKNLVNEVTEARDRIEQSLKDAGNEKEVNQIQEQVDDWQPKQLESAGTGFYIDKNHILTNAHVVTWETSNGDDHPYDEFCIPYRRVTLKAVDPVNDLALLYDERGNTDENGDAVIAKFRQKPVEFGEKISLFGYPQSSRLSYEGNLTSGIVSGLSNLITHPTPENRFQHTAPMQRGNSGGPVFDAEGHVIGVCVSGLPDPYPMDPDRLKRMGVDVPQFIDLAQNINFAIHYNVVVTFLRNNSIYPSGAIDSYSEIEKRYEELKKLFATPSIADPVPSTAEPFKEIPLVTIKTEAKKFTVPVLCFKNKADAPLSVVEITLDQLK